MKKIILILVITCLWLFSSKGQDIQRIILDGDWKFMESGAEKWMDARVPGCTHLDLIKNGKIDDPFLYDNESKVQWVAEKNWEYEKKFNIDEDVLKRRRIDLVFEGLDTYAQVFLNDSLVLKADNMFKQWFADCRRFLKPGENVLRVLLLSPLTEGKAKYDKLPYKLPGGERVVTRKAGYQFGCDWGPTLITQGIWRHVYIKHWDYGYLPDVRFIQHSLTREVAIVSAVFYVNASINNDVTISVEVEGKEVCSKIVSVKRGMNTFDLDFKITDPKRWWTHDLGDPFLYHLCGKLKFDTILVDKVDHRIGLRNVELVRQKDQSGSTFFFRLNGYPLFAKGANYVPQDNFLPRVTDSAYRALIDDAVEANMNMLRVWGGGIYENDVFYDLCDEKGILVWQDFMFASAMYPENRDFSRSIHEEAIQQIVRLRSHPSLALWCGNNEIDEEWHSRGWQKQYGYSKSDSAKIWKDYRTIFHEILPAVVSKFDSGRVYIPSSPFIGRGYMEYRFPESPVMKDHQKHPEGFEIIDQYMTSDFFKPKSFDLYGYTRQLLQARGVRTAIEAHRRAKPYCMGTLFWQFNDYCPTISWSARDYYGRWKALMYTVKDAYKMMLVSPFVEDEKLNIYIVSDSLREAPAVLNLRLMDFDGKTIWEDVMDVQVLANASQVCFSENLANLPSFKKESTLLKVVLISGDKTLAENLLYFVSPKDLKLPKPKFKVTVMPDDKGYKVEISAEKLLKNVYLEMDEEGRFTDNFMDILPGENKRVVFKTSSKINNFEKKLKITTLYDTMK